VDGLTYPARPWGSARAERRRGGMTMIEVLVALGILSVGLIALLAMSLSALHQGRVGRALSLAARIAQDRMEFLQRAPWDDVAPTGGWTANQTVTPPLNAAGDAQIQTFNRQERVAAVPGTTELRTVDVRVTWTEAGDPAGAPPKRYAISSVRHDDP